MMVFSPLACTEEPPLPDPIASPTDLDIPPFDHEDGIASHADAEAPPVEHVGAPPVDCYDLQDDDCEFSRTAFDKDIREVLRERCGDCHDRGSEVEPKLEHDPLLPYVDLENPEASQLLQLVRDGHQCDPCEETADDLLGALWRFQLRFEERETRRAEIQEAYARWQAAGIYDYQWAVFNNCFGCDYENYHVFAVVEQGQVVALMMSEPRYSWPDTYSSASSALSWHTVSGLFEELRHKVEQAPDVMELSFHPQHGFPTHASIDYEYLWFDEEDDYSSSAFAILGEGYCETFGPFDAPRDPESLQTCSSKDACDSCAPLPKQPPCNESLECDRDEDCGADSACIWFDAKCAEGGSYCAPLCPDGVCPEGYRCRENGDCEQLGCDEYPEACSDPSRCDPDAPWANHRGCLPPRCDEGGKDCAPTASCDPAAANAQPDGCAPHPCAEDADCGCGSCIDGGCYPTPGFCPQGL